MNQDTAVSDGIMRLGQSFQGAKTLLTAVELGVFTVLAEGPLDLAALRKRIAISDRGARDFLDALVALGMLVRDRDGRYANTVETGLYLDRSKPTYIGSMLDHLNDQLFGVWGSLTTALRTGKPQTGAISNFPSLYADSTRLELFAKAMTAKTLSVAKRLAAIFPWQDYATVVDIGAAEGCLPVEIARLHAHVSGGGFDLPAMKPRFESYVRKHGFSDRLQFYPGDFLDGPLPSADVLVLGRVLVSWEISIKKMLVQKAYDALPRSGALIVYERFIDDERLTNSDGLLASLNILLVTPGGSNFTGADCMNWIQDVGFHDIRIEPLTSDQPMVVGIK